MDLYPFTQTAREGTSAGLYRAGVSARPHVSLAASASLLFSVNAVINQGSPVGLYYLQKRGDVKGMLTGLKFKVDLPKNQIVCPADFHHLLHGLLAHQKIIRLKKPLEPLTKPTFCHSERSEESHLLSNEEMLRRFAPQHDRFC